MNTIRYPIKEILTRFAISDSGDLIWKENRIKKLVNSPAGNQINKGNIVVALGGLKLQANRIAWILHYKRDVPENSAVIQIDGNRRNFRKENLKLTSQSENSHRKGKLNSNNTSGVRGVCPTISGKWKAYITVHCKPHWLGEYSSIEEAKLARKKAEKKLLSSLRG